MSLLSWLFSKCGVKCERSQCRNSLDEDAVLPIYYYGISSGDPDRNNVNIEDLRF